MVREGRSGFHTATQRNIAQDINHNLIITMATNQNHWPQHTGKDTDTAPNGKKCGISNFGCKIGSRERIAQNTAGFCSPAPAPTSLPVPHGRHSHFNIAWHFFLHRKNLFFHRSFFARVIEGCLRKG